MRNGNGGMEMSNGKYKFASCSLDLSGSTTLHGAAYSFFFITMNGKLKPGLDFG